MGEDSGDYGHHAKTPKDDMILALRDTYGGNVEEQMGKSS